MKETTIRRTGLYSQEAEEMLLAAWVSFKELCYNLHSVRSRKVKLKQGTYLSLYDFILCVKIDRESDGELIVCCNSSTISEEDVLNLLKTIFKILQKNSPHLFAWAKDAINVVCGLIDRNSIDKRFVGTPNDPFIIERVTQLKNTYRACLRKVPMPGDMEYEFWKDHVDELHEKIERAKRGKI